MKLRDRATEIHRQDPKAPRPCILFLVLCKFKKNKKQRNEKSKNLSRDHRDNKSIPAPSTLLPLLASPYCIHSEVQSSHQISPGFILNIRREGQLWLHSHMSTQCEESLIDVPNTPFLNFPQKHLRTHLHQWVQSTCYLIAGTLHNDSSNTCG